MSKPLIPLLTVFLMLWLFGGAYWLTNIHTKNTSKAKQQVTEHLILKDGAFVVESPTIFAFQVSDAELIINEEQLDVFDKLATYLDEKKEKKLRLVAYYGKEELNTTDFKNLGIARGEAIKYILTRRGAPDGSISIESKQFEKLILNENGLLSGGVEFDFFDKETSNTITEAPFLNEKIFYFEKDKQVLSESTELEKFTATLKQFMVDNKTADVIITGFYSPDENKKVGTLRAKYIYDFFIKHEIEKERIISNFEVIKKSNNGGSQVKNPRKVEIKVQ